MKLKLREDSYEAIKIERENLLNTCSKLVAERDGLLSTLSKERDEFGKRETELMKSVQDLKQMLENRQERMCVYREALENIRDTKYDGSKLLSEPTRFQEIAKSALGPAADGEGGK